MKTRGLFGFLRSWGARESNILIRASGLRIVPALAILLAATPLAPPAHAATTYSPCLAEATGNDPSPACVTQSRLGPVTSPPPPGEYLDPLTGLVYARTSQGFAPVGTGALPQFVEQTSVDSAACDSSDPTGCFATGCDAFMPLLHGTDCQETRVALVGCYGVVVTYDDRVISPTYPLGPLSPRPDQSWSGCTPAPMPPPAPALPAGGRGGVGAATPCLNAPDLGGAIRCFPWGELRDQCLGGLLPGGCAWYQIANPGETPDTTSVEKVDGWTYECWYGTGVPSSPHGGDYSTDPSFGPPVPEIVTATLTVTPAGSFLPLPPVQTHAQVC